MFSSHRLFVVSVILSILLFSSHARAQESAVLSPKEEAAAELRKKAVDLLQSLATQIEGLRSGENRARMSSISGELLWKYDERRSRALFAAVQAEIQTGLSDSDSDMEAHGRTMNVFSQLRSDTVTRIASHDPELAFEFLRATRPPVNPDPQYQSGGSEREFELRLAAQVAEKSPKLAARLGRQSLNNGFSSEVISLLQQLRTKDKVAALSLFKAMVEKLKVTDFEDPYSIHGVMFLLQSFRPPDADEAVYRELVGVFVNRATAAGCATASEDEAPSICYSIGRVLPQIGKYDAQGAQRLKRWAPDTSEGDDEFVESPERSLSREVRELIAKGTVDEMLAFADKNPDWKRQIQWEAVSKAQANGDLARARKIAADVPDEYQRRYLLEKIEREEMWTSMTAEKLAAIQEKARQMTNDDERIGFLMDAAYQISVRDPKASVILLNQLNQMSDSMKPGKKQVELKLGLAMLYCHAKNERGFAIMESLLPKFNELVANAVLLEGFETHYLRDSEWNMSGGGGVGEILNALAQYAGFFANADFDRAVELSNQFERPELRLMAKLKLAQSVLAPTPLLTASRSMSTRYID